MWFHLWGTGSKIVASTCDTETDFDTLIEVFTSCDGTSDSCLATNDDDSSGDCGTTSTVEWDSVWYQEYWIFVTGYQAKNGIFMLDVYEGNHVY